MAQLQTQFKAVPTPAFTPVQNDFSQRRSTKGTEPSTVLPIVHEVLRSPGQPLDLATRAFMEPRFRHDFSKVRVHADAKAAESARAVNARAFTIGGDVVFDEGQYAPGTLEGQRLLAHELTHAVQQQKAISFSSEINALNDVHEREADQMSDSIVKGKAGAVTSISSFIPSLQRSVDSSSTSRPTKEGTIPKPTPKEDGSCDCRLDLCWRPIQACWGIIGLLGYKHGFINIINSKCQTHNLYVDPSMHKADGQSHSHAVDSTPGWDTSGETCYTLNAINPYIKCTHIDKLAAATAKYEAMDVAYAAKDGPNSNSFLEWILNDVGVKISGLPAGLAAWDYYIKNPSMRSSPPRVTRAAAPSSGAKP